MFTCKAPYRASGDVSSRSASDIEMRGNHCVGSVAEATVPQVMQDKSLAGAGTQADARHRKRSTSAWKVTTTPGVDPEQDIIA